MSRAVRRVLLLALSTRHRAHFATHSRDSYRQLLLRVHPDFFADDAASRVQNERALQSLNSLLATTKSLDAVDKAQRTPNLEAQFDFVVREAAPSEGQDDADVVALQMRRVSARFVAPKSRSAEGVITYKRRFQDACDALLTDLLRQVGAINVHESTHERVQRDEAAQKARESGDEASSSTADGLDGEPFWIDTDMPIFKKDRDAADIEVMRDQFLRYMLADMTLVAQKAEDDGIDPTIELHKYVPLLHESSIHSPLLTDAERDAALRVLKAHLIQLSFLDWHSLPILLTLPAAAREANPDNARAEDSFLAEFGRGYVRIPTDFAADIAGTRRRILDSLPSVRRATADLQRGAAIIHNLLRTVANGPLRFASLSIEAPLLSTVPVLRLLEQLGAAPPEWLNAVGTQVTFLADMHISIVEPKPRNFDARAFAGAQRANTITVYGDSEAGVLSIDLRRWRLRIPTNVTLEQLTEFFTTPENRVLLYGIRSQIDTYTRRVVQFNRLVETVRSALGFTAILIDADLNQSTGQYLPPDLTTTESGTLLVPYSFGPLVSEHAAQNRVSLRRAFHFVQDVVNHRLAKLLDLINDRSDIILVLSNRFSMTYLDEKSNMYRTQRKQIRQGTKRPDKQLVLRVPLEGFTVAKLRKFLTEHRM
jgi:hypothetical protein